jgi:hypothetical protein
LGRFSIAAGRDANAGSVFFGVVKAEPSGQRRQDELDRLAIDAFDTQCEAVVKSFSYSDDERFFNRLQRAAATAAAYT